MAKVARRAVRRVIRLQPGEKAYVGVDTHQQSYHVSVWSCQREEIIAAWVQTADPRVLVRRLERHREQVAWVVYEAGPTGYGLVRALRAVGLAADVIAAAKTPSPPGREAKSDRLDSGRLAAYAAKGMLRVIQVPSEEEEAHRQVVRLREQVGRKLRRVKVQIRSFLLQHGLRAPAGLRSWSRAAVKGLREMSLEAELRFVLDVMLEELAWLEYLLEQVMWRVETLASTERHREAVERLESVPGVGLLTAMTYRTELLKPSRFDNAREVASAMGLAPLVRSSGMTRREGRVMKAGNQRLKRVLVEAAWQWVAREPTARQRYRKLRANSGSAQVAIVAMARRLGIILWRMTQREEPYRAAA